MVLHTGRSCGSKPKSKLKLQPMARAGWRFLGSVDKPDCLQGISSHRQDVPSRNGEEKRAELRRARWFAALSCPLLSLDLGWR